MLASFPSWRGGGRAGVRLAQGLLDAVLPPRCPACGLIVARQGDMCGACWSGLRFIAQPRCDRCAIPVPQAPPGTVLCPACITEPPAFDRARAALRYDGPARAMILAMKHRGRMQATGAFGTWMAACAGDLLAEADALVPVPLHRWRLVKRGFNQSALLARVVGRRADVPVLLDALVRARATRSQQGLSAAQRADNITAAAFAVPARRGAAVAGRKLVLVDDVLTTGTTLSACARTLKRAGAATVDVLVLARVARDEIVTISSESDDFPAD